MRRWLLGICLLGVLGCGSGTENVSTTNSQNGGDSKPKDPGQKLRIAVIPKGTTHEFWKSVHAGAQNAAKELGNVEVLWKGPIHENDRDGQISVMSDFVSKKVDGICLAPLDHQALVDSVHYAKQNGIPVVIFDSGLADENIIVSYVATDNRRGGELAAKRMGEALGGKGGVIMLRYNQGSESTMQREEGFLETLKQDFPDITVVSADDYAGTTADMSLTKSQDVIGKFRDQVHGCFAVCEPNADGMHRALINLELAGKVKFIAFDPNAALIDGMKTGSVHGIVLQDPVTMGYQSVMTIVKHLRGEKVEKRVNTGEYVATPENMNTDEMKKLLEPEQF